MGRVFLLQITLPFIKNKVMMNKICSIMSLNAFIQWFYSMSSFNVFIKWLHSMILFNVFIQCLHWMTSLNDFIQCLHSMTSFNDFIQCFHSMTSFYAFIQKKGSKSDTPPQKHPKFKKSKWPFLGTFELKKSTFWRFFLFF